jgi:hypothetical protein
MWLFRKREEPSMFGRKRLIYGLALLAALVMTALFSVRAAQHAETLRTGGDEPLRSWMNAPYLARSYRVPLPVVLETLGVEEGPAATRPLSRIARDQNRPLDEIMNDLRVMIAQNRVPPTPAPHEIDARDPPTPTLDGGVEGVQASPTPTLPEGGAQMPTPVAAPELATSVPEYP